MLSKVLTNRKTRTIYLIGDVTARMATNFRRAFGSLEASAQTPINVEVNSTGGEVEAGLAISDTIRGFAPGVGVTVAGYAMSMASLILASGSKRGALRNSVIMVHPGRSTLAGKDHEIRAEFEECSRLQSTTWTLMDQYTNHEVGYWQAKCDKRNLYLTAEQALAEGIIDKIL